MFRLITLSLGLLFLSFTPPPKFSYRVECISVNSDGTVALKIWDTKKGKGYKAHSASIDAVHCVLYSGLSGGSCGRQNPLLIMTMLFQSLKMHIQNSLRNRGITKDM